MLGMDARCPDAIMHVCLAHPYSDTDIPVDLVFRLRQREYKLPCPEWRVYKCIIVLVNIHLPAGARLKYKEIGEKLCGKKSSLSS